MTARHLIFARGRLGLGLLLLGLLCGGPLWAQVKAKKAMPANTVARVGWLAGMWRLEKNGLVVDEQWMMPGGGLMLGMGRTIMKGLATEHELFQLREGPGGDLFLIIEASGKKQATYKSLSVTGSEIVFANQLQDFPQSITYTLRSDSTLAVSKAGPGENGQVRTIETVYQRFGP